MLNNIVALEDNYAPKDKWLRVEWNLGKRCNYDCSYCGSDIHNNFEKHMDLDVYQNAILKISEAAKKLNKIVRISFTGGEPFVHPKIITMLEFAKANEIDKISVTTNGSLPLKRYILSLPYINYYIFSYHFEFAEKDKIIDTIINLKKYLVAQEKNNNIHVHLMFLPGHLKDTKNLINICNDYKVHWVIRRIRPKFDPNTNTWASPGFSGMQTTNKKCLDEYYSKEELNFLSKYT